MKPERFELFNQLMGSELCKQCIGIRAVLVRLFTCWEFGQTGMSIRRSIDPPISAADFAFTYPLMLNAGIVDTCVADIVHGVESASDVNDLHSRLTPLSRAVVYTHDFGALNFYKFPLDTVPDVDHGVIRDGFNVLYNNAKPIVEVFKPPEQMKSTIAYNLPPKSDFKAKDTMAWYLCATDLLWTCDLFAGFKSATRGAMLLPINAAIHVAEIPTQNFCDLYSTGIHALAKNETLTRDQYIILNMIFGIDMGCYNDFTKYYMEINALPDRFFDEMNIFCNNVKVMYTAVQRSDYATSP